MAVLQAGHETVPETGRATTQGLLLNFEVEDVDSVYERLVAAAPILLSLRDEDFGQRHFIAEAPGGIMIDVITPIPPSPEFATQYTTEALPT